MGITDNFEHKYNKEDHKCSQTTQKVNVSELGLVTPAGKFVWSKGNTALLTDNPENDGSVNAVRLV